MAIVRAAKSADDVAMTPPITSSRVLLVSDRRAAGDSNKPVVRRYRIVQLPTSGRGPAQSHPDRPNRVHE